MYHYTTPFLIFNRVLSGRGRCLAIPEGRLEGVGRVSQEREKNKRLWNPSEGKNTSTLTLAVQDGFEFRG